LRETATVETMATPSAAADLEGGVVEARGEPGFMLGDAR
jgi:hypothetical protein